MARLRHLMTRSGYQKCNYSPVESDRRKEVTLALSSADATPLYGFILLPGTISRMAPSAGRRRWS